MRSFGLALSRFCASAWVGAATLFVVTSVREVTFPAFDSATRSALASLRFPAYYGFGFGLVGGAFVASLFAPVVISGSSARMRLYQCLLAAALLAMVADYAFIYTPLAEMTAAAESARPANFATYHRASMYVNAAQLGLCFIASFIVCWPAARRQH